MLQVSPLYERGGMGGRETETDRQRQTDNETKRGGERES